MTVNGLILAAGMSSRMGGFKPLMPVDGSTLLERSVQSMLDGGVSHVTVVLGYRAADVASVLRKNFPARRLDIACNLQYESTDMLVSAKIGIAALPKGKAFFLLPGDMPAVDEKTFFAIREAMNETRAKLAFPVFKGQRRHPPLISYECIPAILNFNGPGGLRKVWGRYASSTAEVAVDDVGCLLDADTPEAYNRLLCFMKQRNFTQQTALDSVITIPRLLEGI